MTRQLSVFATSVLFFYLGWFNLDSLVAQSVPPPSPAQSDYLVGAFYFGGWQTNSIAKSPWKSIYPFIDRTPILGYYDGASPEVADWEVKWALENGIQFFIYDWYRKKDDLGQPVSVSTTFDLEALHNGLFKSHFRSMFHYAIMWENRNESASDISSEHDLISNVVPFWIEHYFKDPGYLRIGGKPVLFVYGPERLVADLGSVSAAKAALAHMRGAVTASGLPGLLVYCEEHQPNFKQISEDRDIGCDVMFAYAIGPPWGAGSAAPSPKRPTAQEAIDWQLNTIAAWKDRSALPFVVTASVGWDPMAWSMNGPGAPDYLREDRMVRWRLSPEQFGTLLAREKQEMESVSRGAETGHMILIDNWNEWGEGHFIAPNTASGFGYLDAIRGAFTSSKNTPDHRSPFELGFKDVAYPDSQPKQ